MHKSRYKKRKSGYYYDLDHENIFIIHKDKSIEFFVEEVMDCDGTIVRGAEWIVQRNRTTLNSWYDQSNGAPPHLQDFLINDLLLSK